MSEPPTNALYSSGVPVENVLARGSGGERIGEIFGLGHHATRQHRDPLTPCSVTERVVNLAPLPSAKPQLDVGKLSRPGAKNESPTPIVFQG